VKINMVALRGVNEDEISPMLAWCGERGFDLSLIETMPLGEMVGREASHLSLAAVKARLARDWTLTPSHHATGGPSRYLEVEETGTRLGLITPLSEHFCAACNRVRLSAQGRLYLCLGHEESVDLRAPLRAGADDAELGAMIGAALAAKPERHEFDISRVAVARYMSATGG
jgi:cyclic pyranopterin phosphate synthase